MSSVSMEQKKRQRELPTANNCRFRLAAKNRVMHFLISHYVSFCIQLDTNTGYRTYPNKTENVPVVFRNHGSRLKHWFYWWMWLKQSCGVQCVNVFLQRINQQAAVNPQQALSKCRYVLFTHLSSWTHTNNASVHCISILLNFVRPCPSCLGYEQVLNVQPPMGGCETPCLLLSAAGRRAICLSHLLLLGL